MFDKIDVRIPRGVPLTGAYVEACRELSVRALHKNFYRGHLDLRKLGLQAILHHQSWSTGDSKLMLLGVGERSFGAILNEIGSIVDVDPGTLAVMRIDFAVDVPEFPVAWFKRHTFIANKRYRGEYGTQYSEVKGARTETLYFGKRPNCFRIYDKILEQLRRRGRHQHHHELPGNDSACRAGNILTRVERQCGGNRVPSEMQTLSEIQRNWSSFEPFEAVQFRSISGAPYPGECRSISEFLKRNGLYHFVQDVGFDEARKALNAIGSRNAARIFKRYSQALQLEDGIPDLHALYMKSLEKQFVDQRMLCRDGRERLAVSVTATHL